MKPSSLEPGDSGNGKTQRFPTVRGSELGSHTGQVQLGTTALCCGLGVAQVDFLVARPNFNTRQYKKAQSIVNVLWIFLLSSLSFEAVPLNMMKINLLLPVIAKFEKPSQL